MVCKKLELRYFSILDATLGCDRNRMQLLSKASNIVQNIFSLYDVTSFT
jgi:hypothetical protein